MRETPGKRKAPDARDPWEEKEPLVTETPGPVMRENPGKRENLTGEAPGIGEPLIRETPPTRNPRDPWEKEKPWCVRASRTQIARVCQPPQLQLVSLQG